MSVLHPVCAFTLLHGIQYPLITWSQYVPDELNISKFVIYRSVSGETKQDDYKTIGKSNTNFYIDTSIEQSRMQPVAYKVGWEDDGGNFSPIADAEPVRWNQAYEQVTTGKTYTGPQDMMYYYHLEHQRRMAWMNRNFGEDAWIYIKNLVGDLCPNFDPITREHTEANCDLCFGRIIIPAYTIYKTQVPFATANDQLDQTQWGLKVMVTTNFRIGTFPFLKDGDLIRRQTGDLGIISDIQRDFWMTEQSGNWNIADKYIIEQKIPLDDKVIDLTQPSLDSQTTWT